LVTFAALAILTLVGVAQPASAAPDGQILGAGSGIAIPGRYLVVLKDTGSLRAAGVAASAGALAGKYSGKIRSIWERSLSGFSVAMSEAAAKRLAADPDVAYVEQDQVVQLADTQDNPPSWGLDRVDQRNRPLDNTYSYDVVQAPQVTAYIVDTGIRITHNEFGGRASYGWDFTNNLPLANDCHTTPTGGGHGTHVAGTVGGKTYGVAKNVKLVAVKVFDCSGKATSTSIQDGVEWVTTHAVKPAVANVSIGYECKDGGGNPAPCPLGTGQAVKDAIKNSIAAGISWVVAGGNENIHSCHSPYPQTAGVIAVGSVDLADGKSAFSNWGGCIDLWAPGEGIVSASNVNDTAPRTSQGTSMAAPHVAGAIALMMARPGPAKNPAELKAQLLAETTPNVITGLDAESPNKLLYIPAPPVAGGSPVALARHQNGRLALFGANQAGTMWYRSQTQVNADTWSAWIQSQNQSWYSACAGTDSAARLKLVGLRRNQEVWHRTQAFANSDSFTAWQKFDGLLTSCAVALDGTKLKIFGTNALGQVFTRSEVTPQGAYTPWTLLAGIQPMRSVAAELNSNGQVELFGLTRTGQIWHCWNTATNCPAGSWFQLDGQLATIALARNGDGTLAVLGANAAGQVFQRHAGPGVNAWFNWSQLTVPTTVGTPRSVAAETNADGRITLIAVNAAGQIWHTKQVGALFGPWTQLDGQLRP
jgi:hypothetical protein